MQASFILLISQIIVSIALIICILLQQRGGGIGILGGLQTQFYGTRRGLEKFILGLTIVLGILFIALAIISFVI